MKRRIEFLTRKIAQMKDAIDHAVTVDEICKAYRMLRAYESALMALEEEQ